MQLVIEGAVEIGKDLIEQKSSLGHGSYMKWIETEFQWSQSYADKFVHVARTFGDKLPSISNLGATALYALAAPSTPEPIREQVLERAAG